MNSVQEKANITGIHQSMKCISYLPLIHAEVIPQTPSTKNKKGLCAGLLHTHVTATQIQFEDK